MKLRDGFMVQSIEDVQFLVPLGDEAFRGLVRSNRTAAFIINCLQKETSAEDIISRMSAEYDAPEETIRQDVAHVLDTLRSIHALDE